MAKKIHTSLFFLCLFYPVSISCAGASGQGGQEKPLKGFMSLIPAAPVSSFLPRPPVTTQDRFMEPTMNISRLPAALKSFNQPRVHPLSEQDRVRLEVIPPGLRYHWNDIKSELEWFDEREQVEILSEFLQIVVQDNRQGFYELEPKFIEVFGTDYRGFALNGRTVLSWLISFGAADILSSGDFSKHIIDSRALDQALIYLVQNHSFRHLATMVALLPFLTKPNVKGIFYHAYHSHPRHLTAFDSIGILFSEMQKIDVIHIAALLPIFTPGKEISELINFSFGITKVFRESNRIFLSKEDRDNLYIRYKFALNSFFSQCIQSFNLVSREDRSPILNLFIEFDNLAGFTLLITSPNHKDLFTVPANILKILSKCIEKRALNCARFIMKHYNETVVTIDPSNGYQAPIFRAMMENLIDLFKICLENLFNNEPFAVHGSPNKFSPIALALMQENPVFLELLLAHFNQLQVSIDLRKEFNLYYEETETAFVERHGTEQIRTAAFIPHSIWVFLLRQTSISLDIVENRSLLDYAVLDRNSEAVRIIVEERGFDINTVIRTGNLRGNCLRFVKGDVQTFAILLKLGININLPVTVVQSDVSPDAQYSEEECILVRLMHYSNPEFQEYLSTVQFSIEVVLAAQAYATQHNRPSTLSLANSILEKYENGTFH